MANVDFSVKGQSLFQDPNAYVNNTFDNMYVIIGQIPLPVTDAILANFKGQVQASLITGVKGLAQNATLNGFFTKLNLLGGTAGNNLFTYEYTGIL